jgi:hypothetical protein
MRSDVELEGQQIARLNAEVERLREERRRWIALADQWAIEVGTLKTEIKQLQRSCAQGRPRSLPAGN